ncbi:MAG TPA: hypothetical protein VIV12_14470 [Streptosporangiaceae bacterium]
MDPPVQAALTDPAVLAQRINAAGGASGVAASVEWFTENADDLATFTSAEDLGVQTGGEGPFAHHLMQVRAELARQLWQRRLSWASPCWMSCCSARFGGGHPIRFSTC